MRTLYLDHSIIAREEYWPIIRSAIDGPQAPTIVASDWNLVEIAQGSDRAQAMRRADFISSLAPQWAMPRLWVQRMELQRFLEETFWHTHSTPVTPFTPSFAVMMAANMRERAFEVPIGWGAREYVANLHDHPAYIREIEAAKQPCVDALRTLQAAGSSGRLAIEETVLRGWIAEKLPDANPDGRLITVSDRRRAIEHCVASADELSSPAIAVENALSQVRARDAKRTPEPQDAIDFQHAVVALAYCEGFAVRDAHLLHCARETAKLLSPMKVAQAASLSELLAPQAATTS